MKLSKRKTLSTLILGTSCLIMSNIVGITQVQAEELILNYMKKCKITGAALATLIYLSLANGNAYAAEEEEVYVGLLN